MSKFANQIQVTDDLNLISVQIAQSDQFFEVIKMNTSYFSQVDFISPNFDSVETVKSAIKSLTEYKDNSSGVNYGLWQGHNLLGLFTVNRTDWEKKSADVGFWLIESATGKGYASMSFSALCGELKMLGLHFLTASTAVTNKRAQVLLEKNGFQNKRILEKHIDVRGKKIDAFFYELNC